MLKMKRSGPSLLVSLLFIFVLFPEYVVPQEVPEWASSQLGQWYAAYNSVDVDRVTRLYSEDAVLTNGQGRKIQIERLTEAFADSNFSCSGDFESFAQVGHSAVGWGYDECTVTSKGGGPGVKNYSKWLVVFELQDDDSWLIVRDVGEQAEK